MVHLLEILASIIGSVGGALGIISWRQTRKIQKYTIEDIEKQRAEKAEEDDLYAEIMKNHQGSMYNTIPLWRAGSKEFVIADRLVARGKLFREGSGWFTLWPPNS